MLAQGLAWSVPSSLRAESSDKDSVSKKSISLTRTDVDFEELKIVWNLKDNTTESDPIEQKTENKTWLAACNTLGKSMSAGQGPWGLGVFSSYSCWLDDKKISSGPAKNKAWILEYKETEENVFLVLSDSDHRKMAEVIMAPSRSTSYFFADREFCDLMAMKLLDGMPTIGVLSKGAISGDGAFKSRYPYANAKGGRKFPLIYPPKNIVGYKLYVDPTSGVFSADTLGAAAQKTVDPEVVANDKDKSAKKIEKPSAEPFIHWQATEELSANDKEQSIWFHNQAGRNKRSAEIQPAIDQAQKILAEAAEDGVLSSVLRGLRKGILATTASGYVGLRYGPQVLPGDPLLAKTAFFGVIGEVRGGPLAGLRLYYDKVPMTTVQQNGVETSIAWGRFIVGKSFGLNLSKFVDRIDITPKLGLWNFHAKLPTDYDTSGQVTKAGAFDLDRAMSFALEAGVEWSSSWYAIRPWYSFDGAAAISKVNKKRVTSNRVGLDSYWTAGPKFSVFKVPFKTTWLLFAVYETIGLTNTDPKTELEDGESEITGITFSSGYTGAGVAISW